MLPFVRGVDLSGNDFKVSRTGGGPGSPPSRLFHSCPRWSLLPVLSASGPSDRAGPGGALLGLGSPALNAQLRGRTGRPRPGRAGSDA